ncbi:hypothetical protein PAPHI01_1620 [Pancytospora philotis]|nr:hypothetical protein PAPHI01_1620 [Pancytospora philotis]
MIPTARLHESILVPKPMYFSTLAPAMENVNSYKVYALALVDAKVKPNTYRVRYEANTAVICTDRALAVGAWIRFCGVVDKGVIACEYVEALDNVDTNLLVRCIQKLGA